MKPMLPSIPCSSKMPKRACPMPTQSHQWLGIIAFLLLAAPSQGQVGTNICACTPPTYEFTLNFDLTCDNTFVPSSGVAEFECVVQPFQTGATIDLRPARVETIDFVEYDQSNRRLAEASIFDPVGNGETITYTSYSANPGDVTTPTVPKALQITMLAQNSVGQPLLMTWLIAFTNSCATYPVITVGNQIGWTEISMTSEPDASLCPAVNPQPTPPPVHTPTPPTPPTPPGPGPSPPCRPPGKGVSKGKGKGGNVFYGPGYYSYNHGKGYSYSKSSKSSSSSSKSSKSRRDRRLGSKSSSSSSYGYWYHHHQTKGGTQYWFHHHPPAKGKGYGKGGSYDSNDLPLCPPDSSSGSGASRSYHAVAGQPSGDDDDQVYMRYTPPTMAPVSPSQPTVQQSEERPVGGSPTGQNPQDGSKGDGDVSLENWGTESENGTGVRAALFAGAGVAAGLIAVVATYIYRREKQYQAQEAKLQALDPRLGALPRVHHLPVAQTMSTSLSDTETTSFVKH